MDALETNSETGIQGDDADIRRRRTAFGHNSSYMDPQLLDDSSFLRIAQKYLKDRTVVLLLCCTLLASIIEIKRNGAVEGLIDGATMLLAVSLLLSLGFLCRHIRLRITRRRVLLTKKKLAAAVCVIRHGNRGTISDSEVVVGDIISLEAGDKVPADGFLIVRDSSFKHDQRLNSTSVNPSLFSGATVKAGSGRMLAVSVGNNTERSRLMRSKEDYKHVESTLQISIDEANTRLERALLSFSLFVLIVQLLRCFLSSKCDATKGVENTVEGLMHEWTTLMKQQQVGSSGLIKFLSVLIFALRDGLPLGVLVVFVYTTRKVKSYGANVQRLSACGTIGSINTFCSGAITDELALNTSEVADLWIGFDWIKDASDELAPQVLQLLRAGISVCDSHGSNVISYWAQHVLGEPNKENEETVVHIHRSGDELEEILSSCSHYVNRDGKVETLDDDQKDSLTQQIASINSLQVFAFAYKHVIQDKDADDIVVDDDKVFLALVSLKNPYPPEMRRTIQEFQSSGISIKLAVETDVATARMMATYAGILRPEEDVEEAVIEASDFLERDEEERRKTIGNIHVITNASPVDKLEFVQCLKQNNNVVAFSSSCTRDIPTLKEADVGIFVGDDVDFSDIIIIAEKNFATVLNVVRLGRSVYESVKMLVQLQLSLNITAFFVNYISAMANKEVQVIFPFQVLWMNLAMDLLGALALAIGIVECTRVTLTLNGEDDQIITRTTWRNIGVQSWSQVAILMAVQMQLGRVLFEKADESVLMTLINGCYVLCQVFSLITSMMILKKKKFGLFEGLLVTRKFSLILCIVGSIAFLEVGLVEIMAMVAHWGSLSSNQWLICIGVAAASIPVAKLFTV